MDLAADAGINTRDYGLWQRGEVEQWHQIELVELHGGKIVHGRPLPVLREW